MIRWRLAPVYRVTVHSVNVPLGSGGIAVSRAQDCVPPVRYVTGPPAPLMAPAVLATDMPAVLPSRPKPLASCHTPVAALNDATV